MKRVTDLFDPSRNPAVLDTATWDRAAAWRAVLQVGERWAAARTGGAVGHGVATYGGSIVRRGAATFLLAGLSDGQQVFVELGRGGAALGFPRLAGRESSSSHGIRRYMSDTGEDSVQ